MSDCKIPEKWNKLFSITSVGNRVNPFCFVVAESNPKRETDAWVISELGNSERIEYGDCPSIPITCIVLHQKAHLPHSGSCGPAAGCGFDGG